ncbi:MAG: single-stranded DNA-binding protein [Candidatus Delongbacteria bacterium]|jgi:single-strand DNA-binding protein|nr:single-stranded DNA-binding protein [Candidatus Delongbacteria bacterium]
MNNVVNRVMLIGNIGGTPELKELGNDNHVLNLSVATNVYYKDNSGNRQQKTTWHRVVAWNGAAKFLADKCQTGSRLLVEGKLENKQWEKNGEKRYSTEIRLTEFMLLDSKD